MKNKILISGVNGFVGTSLSQSLKNRGKLLIGISRSPKADQISYENVNQEFLNSFDCIIHLAGIAHDLKVTSNYTDYIEVNFKLTKNLFDAFLESNCKDFIFFSSVKAVTDEAEDIVTEETIANPKSAYGQSKSRAEEYILSKRLPSGKRVFILRPTMIYGPENKGNMNLLYSLVSKGIPWPLGAFENKRSFCSIDNLLFVINELIERDDISSGIYNVADDEALSTNELIGLIAQSQNRRPKVWKMSKKFIKVVAVIGDKLHLPLNSERLEKLTSMYVVSNAKILAVIGKPLPVSSRVGLLKTFKSYNNK